MTKSTIITGMHM